MRRNFRLSRETDGDHIVPEKAKGDLRFRFDRVTLEFVRMISPMPHGFGGSARERAIATQNINFSYGTILPYYSFQTDFSGQGRIPRNRVLESALRRLRNLRAFL
jgi:hypothetical protein